MREALQGLDHEVSKPLCLLIGGGAAFVLAHQIPLSTMDIDAIPYQTTLQISDLEPLIQRVSKKLNLPHDWLNTYFATFTYSLPKDYSDRLVRVFRGKNLTALALGREDLLIMKCFAGREKDFPHARALLKKGLDVKQVKEHLHRCVQENLPKASAALDVFYDACEQTGIEV